MKAIICAAGKSPRLLPLTKNLPVSLLKIKDKTILDLQLEVLSRFDFSKIIIISGFQSDKLEALDFFGNIEIFFNPYYEFSNIPASLRLIKEQLKEDFILFYADVLFRDIILKKLIKAKGDIVLAIDSIRDENLDQEAEKVIIDNEFIVKLNKTSIKKTSAGGEFIGMAKFSAKVFPEAEKALEKIVRNDLTTSFINFLNLLIVSGQQINYIEVPPNSWMEIDFPKDLENARKNWQR